MPKRKRTFLIRVFYLLIDVLFVGLSIFVACLIRKKTLPFPASFGNIFLNTSNNNPFQFIFLFWIFSILIFNHVTGLYQTRRELLRGFEVINVGKSIFYSSIATIAFVYILKFQGFPRSIILLATVFSFVILSIWRMVKRSLVSFLVSQGYNNFNVLIVGAGKIGVTLAEEINQRRHLGFKIIGFLDDFKPVGDEYSNCKILGKIADFERIARHEFVNKIFITIHHDSQVFIQLLEQARRLNVSVRVVPQGFEFSSGEFFKYNIGFIPILEYCDQENRIKQFGKRLFDFFFSLLTLILFSPVFIFLAILIKGDSRGPVFYASQRYGFRGKRFFMLKFRSMQSDADKILHELKGKNEVDGPIFKIKADPRITRVGKFLRRYSLDELPQLFNVLVGDMSLVGPRPLPIEQIEKEDLRQLRRLEVRPGITGLWQIRGRSDISFVRLVKWDIWYINNWSFWLNLNILFQTIPVVMKGRGAY